MIDVANYNSKVLNRIFISEIIGEVEFVDIRISCELYKNVTNLRHFGTEHSLAYRITSSATKSENTADISECFNNSGMQADNNLQLFMFRYRTFRQDTGYH